MLLALALILALGLVAFERFNCQERESKLMGFYSASDHRTYAAEQDARLKALEQQAAAWREAVEAIRREQSRQGAQLDRLLERLQK